MSPITDSFCIHGVELVVVSDDGRAASAVRELLQPYLHKPSQMTLPRVHVHLALATGSTARACSYPSEAPVLTYDAVRGYARPDATVLTDGFSQVQVMRGGHQIRACLREQTLSDPYQFAALLFNMALQLCLREHGLYYTHAAALVAPDGRTVLFTGNSGAGKSTLAVSLALARWTFVSDDALFLRHGPVGPEVLAFRRPVHLDCRALEAFPMIRPMADGPHMRARRTRWDIAPSRAFGTRIADRADAPAVLVLLDRSVDQVTQIRTVDAPAALDGLLRQSGLVMLGGNPVRHHLETLAKVVRNSAHYAISVGIDMLGDSAITAAHLQDVLDRS